MTATYDLNRGFTITRLLDAPRERVFQAWTDPDHLQWFFNPATPASKPTEVDLRVGGDWRQQMVIDNDTEYITGGRYLEIVPVERLVFLWGATDGWPVIDEARPDDGPVATVILNEVGDRTEMIFTLALPDHLSEERARTSLETGMREGWTETLDRLVADFAGVPSGS